MGTQRLVRLVVVAVLVGGGVLVAACALPAGATPGMTWVSQSVPTGTGSLTGISCPSARRCVAVGRQGAHATILTTRNGGKQWSSQTVPTGAIPFAVSCPTVTDCVAVGGGTIITTSDGGSTWVSRPVPSGVVDLDSVSCPSATDCVAVGATIEVQQAPPIDTGDIVTTSDGGTTWVKTVPAGTAPSPQPLFSVSCASTTVCVAVGVGDIPLTTTDGGTTWINQAGVPDLTIITSVSCPSISTCVAGGSIYQPYSANPIATTDGGTTWVSQTPPSPPPGAITGMSCASTTTCVAVAGSFFGNVGISFFGNVGIMATTDGGAIWTNETVPSGVAGLSAVSCPSRFSCAAVGQNAQGGGVIIRTG